MPSTKKLGGDGQQLPSWARSVPPPSPREGPRLQQESKQIHRSYSLGSGELEDFPGYVHMCVLSFACVVGFITLISIYSDIPYIS